MVRETVINLALVYLLIFTSGSMLFEQSADKYLSVVLLVTVLIWLIFTDRKIHNRFILYVSIFSGILLMISLYTGGSLSIASVVALTAKLVLAYLILKMVGEKFAGVFVNLVVFLAIVSLFGYLSDIFYLFDGLIRKLPQVGSNGYEGIFYLFRYKYQGYDRNNSIFFEPGAYQGFLNAAIFMLFFLKFELGDRRRWGYILILLTALFTTYSTTGFIIFSVMFVLFLWRSTALSAFYKSILAGLVIVSVAIFSAQFQEVLLEKIDVYLSGEEASVGSALKRSFDKRVDLEIIRRHMFGLGYSKYREEFSSIGGKSADKSTSSNGVTKLFAIYGIPFGLFYFASFYWALKQLLPGFWMSATSFGMLLLFLVGESYYNSAPIVLAIIAAAFVYGDTKRSFRVPDRGSVNPSPLGDG